MMNSRSGKMGHMNPVLIRLLLLLPTAVAAGLAGAAYQETRPLMGMLVSIAVDGTPDEVRETVIPGIDRSRPAGLDSHVQM